MRKLILAAAALTLMSGAALASEVDGVVAKFNPSVRVVTLTNCESFTIPRDVAIPSTLHAGQKVAILQHDDGADINAVLVGSYM